MPAICHCLYESHQSLSPACAQPEPAAVCCVAVQGSDADMFIRKQLLNMAGFPSHPGGLTGEQQLQMMQHAQMMQQQGGRQSPGLGPGMSMHPDVMQHMGAPPHGGMGMEQEHMGMLPPRGPSMGGGRWGAGLLVGWQHAWWWHVWCACLWMCVLRLMCRIYIHL